MKHILSEHGRCVSSDGKARAEYIVLRDLSGKELERYLYSCSFCFDGHLMSPYEQNTQQSPGLDLIVFLQLTHV